MLYQNLHLNNNKGSRSNEIQQLNGHMTEVKILEIIN